MTSWHSTVEEINRRNGDCDNVRRERIRAVEAITGRPLIIYASDFYNRDKLLAAKGEVMIDPSDKVGFSEVIENITGDNLDILIQSPGGYAESAEAIINLLRAKFTNIRFIVPDQAKSAATMMCCSADEILLNEKSELGPIDPQMQVPRNDGIPITAPSQAILDQFDKAKEDISKKPELLPVWLPILNLYGPSLLVMCEDAEKLARSLVEKWLLSYMFKDVAEKEVKVNKIVDYLSDYKSTHLSHARSIGISNLQDMGMNIIDLRKDKPLNNAIWNLYLAIKCTFDFKPAFKIIENGQNVAYIRMLSVQQIQLPLNMNPQNPPQQHG